MSLFGALTISSDNPRIDPPFGGLNGPPGERAWFIRFLRGIDSEDRACCGKSGGSGRMRGLSLFDFVFSHLYVRGSLCNKAEGIGFTLRNAVAPAIVTGLTRVEIDGRRFAPDGVAICQGSGIISAAQITDQAPLALDLGTVVDILIPGGSIRPGTHTVTMGVIIRGVGEVIAKVTDTTGD